MYMSNTEEYRTSLIFTNIGLRSQFVARREKMRCLPRRSWPVFLAWTNYPSHGPGETTENPGAEFFKHNRLIVIVPPVIELAEKVHR